MINTLLRNCKMRRINPHSTLRCNQLPENNKSTKLITVKEYKTTFISYIIVTVYKSTNP